MEDPLVDIHFDFKSKMIMKRGFWVVVGYEEVWRPERELSGARR